MPSEPARTPDSVPHSAPLDVLCVGLVCVDLLLSVPHHPAPDEKLRATSRLLAPGGPAAVAAAQIARLGGRAAFAGLIGDPATDPFAAILRAAFAAESIDTTALLSVSAKNASTADTVGVPGFETPLAAILVKPDATRAVLSHRPSPPDSVTDWVTPPENPGFPRARVVLADGHRPEWKDALLAHARASAAPLILDAGSWSDSIRALAPHADHLVASEACARSALAGLDPASAAPAALRAALGARPGATVVVTLGDRGLLWNTSADSAAHGRLAAFRIDHMDTTGAGDAFHGAYALGLARGLALRETLRLASAAGALACTRPGAWPALASAAEISAFLALPL